jgi:hypothetical protein
MARFIELPVASDEDGAESKKQIVNVECVGRVYANPQIARRSIVELNYQSTMDAPVFLEVEMAYENLRMYFLDQA